MPPILAPLILLVSFWRGLRNEADDPRFRAALYWLLLLLAVGMVHYHHVEGWSWTDALYFCVITLATVGFGDLSPTTTGSKMFTVVYVILGMSILLSFVNVLAKGRVDAHTSRRGAAAEAAAEDK